MLPQIDAADPLYARKKALLWRCSRRGTAELDLLLGRLAARIVPDMEPERLGEFEALIQEPEPLLQAWLTQTEALPSQYANLAGLLEPHV